MSIELSPDAAARMRDFLARHPQAVGVRFGIKKTGCSGFGYTVDLTETIAPEDRVFDLEGVRVVVDSRSLPFVDGTRIDFEREGVNAAFVFHNPNATGECGCGESFTVDAPA
ncbi:MAG: HesB/IscA family protein [Rhodanobacteraceae bacterium]